MDVGSGGGNVVFEQAGYLHLFDPKERESNRLKIGVATRSGRGPAALRQGGEVHPQCRDFAVGGASRLRVPRRDRDRPRGEGRPPQPHELARRPRPLAGLVAGRQVDRLLLRRGRRVPAARPCRRRQGQARRPTPCTAPASTRSRSGRPTARRSPSSTTRNTLFWIDLEGGKVKKIAVGAAVRPDRAAHTAARLVARLEVDRLRAGQQGGVSHRLRLRPRRGQIAGDHRRAERRHRSGVRRKRQVSLFPGLHRRRAGQPVVRPVQRRHARAAVDLPGGAEKRRPVAAGPRKRRGKARHGKGHRTRTKTPSRRRSRSSSTSTASTSASSLCRCRRASITSLQAGAAGQLFFLEASSAPAARRRRPARGDAQTLRPDQTEDRDGTAGRGQLSTSAPTARRRWCSRRRKAGRSSTPAGKPEPGKGKLNIDAIEVRIDPAPGMAADLRRGLAHQPRLLLRPEHARRRLEGDQAEVRRLPAAPGDARRPGPRHSLDAERAGGRPQLRSRPANGCTNARRFPAGCSAPITRSPTAATASKRSTAG